MPTRSGNHIELLRRFNQTESPYPADTCLPRLFEMQCQVTPGHPAVEMDGSSLTYDELNERSNRIAHWLIAQGVKPDQMIGICADRSFDLVTGILGILKSGCAYVPFDVSYPAERISYMLQESDITTVLVQESYREVFIRPGVITQSLRQDEPGFKSQPSTNPEVSIDPAHLAYVLFTSGSTGMPKGVGMVHRALMNLLAWQKQVPGLEGPARTLQFAPISFDVSFQEMFTTWTTGGTLILINDEMRLNAIRLLEFIQVNRIERLFLPFIALQHLAEVAVNSHIRPAGLHDVITAGEQLRITRHIRDFFSGLPGCRLHNHYGPTETHVVTACTLEPDPASWVTLPPIGKPVSNTRIYLLDDTLTPVPVGEQGEIYVAGVALARGYVNKPALTAERFIRDPFSDRESDRLYRTGDLGRYLPDGAIEYLGRADNQVKVRGYRIEPGEIEITLEKVPAVKQAVVTVREDDPGDKRLVAYILTEAGMQTDAAILRRQLAGKLPEYMMPSAFVFLQTFPKTPSGKIDRKSLPAPDESRPALPVLFAEPQTETEKTVAGLWSQLLRIRPVGLDDNFFDLGGNSLLALRFIARLRLEHNLDIPVVKLYQFPTVRSLLSSLTESRDADNVYQNALKRRLKADSDSGHSHKTVEDGIAIVGMSGRFPGAMNVTEMWNHLLEGKETTSFFTENEVDPFIDRTVVRDPLYVKARGVLTDADKFDAAFFGINPRLAELMDPQQRVFIEVCWEALENAGYTPTGYKGLIGVYAGMGNNTYYQNNVVQHRDAIDKVGSFQVMVANEKDYIATRVSHLMNLTGPGLSVHTACSTSLTAVAMACQALWNYQCDMAIAGGVAITSPVNSGHLYQEGGMFSADGHTRSFDANATGTVFSDGAGTVVLKRYRDALNDGDTIYAVIRGAGVNNDGSGKASFTAPSVEGQAHAIAMAQADAQVSPDTITYVETHGTATPLGDPIEVEALTRAFRGGTDRKQYCAIGSVKSNFGHLTAAAGIASLIKTALALKNRVIPASINYEKPNPAIDFINSPFYVNHKTANWSSEGFPRRAGVSSFGVGGTNVHLVVEEAPGTPPSGPARSKHLLLVSAKSEEKLDTSVALLRDHLIANPEIHIADAAFTLQTGRASFNHRRFAVCDDVMDAVKQLQESNPARSGKRHIQAVSSGVAFMFPGQGSQYVHMGSNLYRDEIVFRESVDRCAELLAQHIGCDIREIIYPAAGDSGAAAERLQETCFTQPALFTIGYALAKLWMSWGIRPVALTGHSIGEFAAACIAGVMSLEDALYLVAHRGKLMQALPRGSMLSVRAGAGEIAHLLSPELSVAAINGPSLCVVSGMESAMEKFQKVLESKEIAFKKLVTSHAFHSPMMDPVIDPFRKLVEGVKLSPPAIPVISTATARLLSDTEATSADYWARHLRLPVRFAEAIQTIWKEQPDRILLELGPRNTASILAKQQASDPKNQVAVPSLPDTPDGDAEWVTMLTAIGRLWLSGISINWDDFYALEKRHHIPLPVYPFERKRYWVDPVPGATPLQTFHPYQPFKSDGHIHEIPLPGNAPVIIHNTIPMNSTSRKDRIISELKNVMEDASGIELATADAGATFVELGLDSLFLTQAALTLSKKYGIKITFRQLNENFSTFNALAAHIDSSLPAETPSAPVPSAPQSPLPSVASMNTAVADGTPGTLQWLITQQLQVMQQQLAMVGGLNNGIPVVPAQPPIVSAHPASTAEVSENEKAELAKPFGAIARIEKTVSSGLTPEQKKWLSDFTARYNRKTAKSKSYTQEHRPHLADPRVVTGFKPALKELIYQVVVERSKGTRLWDLDGNEYIDVLNGFGSNFLGYGSELILKATRDQLEKGMELGPQHPLAGEVAALICEFTGYDRAGFCNTGSEAVLGAMRIARTVTGRNIIVCFNGSYHGINDEVIVRGTRKLKSYPAAAGIMPEAVENMLVLDYGTDEALEIIRSRADEIAAVMVEPIQSRRADFRPQAFLEEVRKITAGSGSLLIFDEVITGFRLHPGGAQSFYGVKADVGTYGKVIGGGMPIGVIAGKKEFMDALDGGFWKFGDDSVPEVGVTYFAGTFVRHPLALAAARAVLLHLKERGMSIYDKLNGFTDRLVATVNAFTASVGAPFHLVHFGSLFKVKWDVEQPYGELIFLLLRDKGIHIYDGFPCFFTDAFTDQDVDKVINAFIEATRELQAIGLLSGGAAKSLNGHKVNGHDAGQPPVPGARLGKDPDGNPGWFVPDPNRPGKFKQVFHS